MKKLFGLIAMFIALGINAQVNVPQAFNYSGVARYADGKAINGQTIGLQISILKGSATGTVEYKENHSIKTDEFGVFNINIGNGTVQTGTFASINWGSSSYFLKVGMDTTGGTSFIDMGTTQLLSVPYALYALTAGIPPTVTTQAATNANDYSATLNAMVNANNFYSNVSFEYGTTTDYGKVAPATAVSGNTNKASSGQISGLTPNTLYHYRAKAINAIEASYGADMTFTTTGGRPSVSSARGELAYDHNDTLLLTNHKFYANINPNGFETKIEFEYGTTTSYGKTLKSTPDTIEGSGYTSVESAIITQVLNNTTFHFRIKMTNSLGVYYSNDYTYTASSYTGYPKIALPQDAIEVISPTSVRIHAVGNANGQKMALKFKYYRTDDYNNIMLVKSTPDTLKGFATQNITSDIITGLTPGKAYYFYLYGTNIAGGSTQRSNDAYYQTAAAVKPVIAGDSAYVGTGYVEFSCAVIANNQSTTVSFEYGKTTSYGSIANLPTTINGNTEVWEETGNITGFVKGTKYYFRTKAVNASGTTYSAGKSFIAQ